MPDSRLRVVLLAMCVSACSEQPLLERLIASREDSILQVVDLTPDVVLGQIALDISTPNFVDGKGLQRPSGVAVDNSVTPPRLYVADTQNNRVLIFANALAFSNGDEAIGVLGQPDMYHASCAAPDVDTLCGPLRVAVDSLGNIYVSDTTNNRVLRYDTPLGPGGDARADRVFGQPNMTTTACGVVSAVSLCGPVGVATDATNRLFVVDSLNHRVVIYPTPAVASTATIVLGQPALDTGGANIIEAGGFQDITSIALDKSVTPNRIYVADRGNNRVLGWVSVDNLFNNQPATLLIGQADFAHGLCNQGGTPTAQTLCGPTSIAVDGAGNLIVSDTNNNRVLGYISPFLNDKTPDARWGQAAYTTNACATDLRTLCTPDFVGVDASGALFVHDKGNGRVLKFSGGMSGDSDPDLLFGATQYTVAGTFDPRAVVVLDVTGNLYVQSGSSIARFDAAPADATADQTIAWPYSQSPVVAANDGSLWVATITNLYRVASPTTALGTAALLGPPNPFLYGSAMTFDAAGNLFAGIRVGVIEFYTPTPGNLTYDRVAGVPTHTTSSPNRIEQGGLSTPSDIAMHPLPNNGFAVSDVDNRRVVVWSSTTVGTGTPPNILIGNTSWTTSATSPFIAPFGLAFDANANLYVADGTGGGSIYRFNQPLVHATTTASASILMPANAKGSLAAKGNTLFYANGPGTAGGIWHHVLRIDGANTSLTADAILGQPDLAHGAANFLDGRGLSGPMSVAIDLSVTPNRIYVGDTNNSRVLGWSDAASLVSGKPADLVIGQTNFFDNLCLPASATGVCIASALGVDGSGRLYALDLGRRRILIFDSPFTTDVVADRVIGASSPTAFTEIGTLAGGLGTPVSMAVDSAGNVFLGAATTLTDITIYRTPRTTDSTVDITIANGMNVLGLAVDSVSGRVYAVGASGQVRYYNDPLTTDGTVDGNFSLDPPTGTFYQLAARDGLVWAGANQLSLFVSPTTGATPVRTMPAAPGGQVAIDSVGSVAVADYANNRVRIYFAQGRPTASNVSIAPATPKTQDTLTLSYVYSDPEAQAQTGTTIRWYADDVLQSAYNNQSTVPASATSKDQVWTAVVQPHDTVEFGPAVTTPAVTIANTAPVGSAQSISPATPLKGSTLTVSWAYTDADGDPQQPAQLRWYRDNVQQVALDNQTTVPGALTSKGQVWRVIIATNDGTALGSTVEAQTVIQNTPPTATSLSISPASPVASSSLTANWTFNDVDADMQSGTVVRWYKNGVQQLALAGQLTVSGPLTLNDDWYFTVTPRDGLTPGTTVASAHVIIGSTAPTTSALSISPPVPRRASSSLIAQYTYSDPDSQTEGATTIRWFKNGVQVNTGASIPGPFTRGDAWYFTVTPCDVTPLCGTTQTSPTLIIANTIPIAAMAAVSPASPKVTDALQASYAFTDGDADSEGGSDLRWFRNGQEQSAYRNVKVLPAGVAKKTELWHFSVTPSDGFDYGVTVTSADVTVANTLPTATALTLTPAAPTVLSTLLASHTFSDADGDLSVGTTLKWFTNGAEDTSLLNAAAVPPSKLTKGEQWRFTVTPSDGTAAGTTATSSIVTIQNSPPSAKDVVITPTSPSVGVPLNLNYTWSDVDTADTEAGTTIRWFKNGVEVVAFANSTTIPGTQSVRGDSWRAEITPSDGTNSGAVVSSTPVVIGNHVPSVSLATIQPAQPKRTDVLQAVYTFEDVDGDVESGSSIEWYRNGLLETALTDQKTVPARTAFKREIWNYKIKPKDGTDFGPAELSSPVVIANSAPVAVAGPNAVLNPTGVLTRVPVDATASTDIDNDVLTFTWYEGTTVLGQGAMANFDLPIGTHALTLTVSDGEVSATDMTFVTVGDAPPVARIDGGAAAPPGPVTLYGSATDALNRPVSYAWKQTAGDAVLDLTGITTPTPTFFALARGQRTFELVATAGSSVSPPETFEVTTLNVAPWAEAPPRQVIAVGTPVTVDGRWSDDPNADSLTFAWSGDGITITDSTKSTTQVALSAEGEATLSLMVNDGLVGSAPAHTSLYAIDTTKPHAPVARARADAAADLEATIVLDGTSSFDVDADALTYRWKQVDGPEAQLAYANTSRAQVRFSAPGTVKLMLTVSDGTASADAQLSIVVGDTSSNHRARVRVTSDLTAHVRDTVVLDASQTIDPDGDTLQYTWRQLSGTSVTLLNASSANASFVALRPGLLRFEVSVWDGALNATSVCEVRVTSANNHLPTADAGAPQSVSAGVTVTLDGTGSSDEDNDPLRLTWVQLEGPPVVLDGPSAQPHFTPHAKKAHYRFQLTAWDAEGPSRPAETRVDVRVHGEVDTKPVAVITVPRSASVGKPVTLDGTQSHDAEQDALSYHWAIAGHPTTERALVLSDDTSATPTFTPNVEGAYAFTLIVDDGALSSEVATATVLVGAWPDSGCSCSNTAGIIWVPMMFVWLLRRRARS